MEKKEWTILHKNIMKLLDQNKLIFRVKKDANIWKLKNL